MTTVYRRSPHIAYIMGYEDSVSSDDASYVANLKTSDIAVLKGPSAVIWEILEQPANSEAIISEIRDIYGVPQETVAPSILSFLDELLRQDLIQRDEGN